MLNKPINERNIHSFKKEKKKKRLITQSNLEKNPTQEKASETDSQMEAVVSTLVSQQNIIIKMEQVVFLILASGGRTILMDVLPVYLTW